MNTENRIKWLETQVEVLIDKTTRQSELIEGLLVRLEAILKSKGTIN